MAGFSRGELRELMIEHAREDARVAAVALLGSAARHAEDEWSDIDLALRLAPGVDQGDALNDWTRWLGGTTDVSDHLDVQAWGAIYRVFLCANGDSRGPARSDRSCHAAKFHDAYSTESWGATSTA